MRPENSDVNVHRLPPHNLDAEKRLLSAMSIDPTVVPEIRAILSGPGDFYRSSHQDIYRAICALADGCGVIDGVTIYEELARTRNLPTQEVLGDVFMAAIDSSNAVYHAGIVREKARLRALIAASTQTLEDVYGQEYTADQVVTRDRFRISQVSAPGGGDGGHAEESPIVWADDVVERQIDWLWPGRAPHRKVWVIAGPGGLGKTFILNDVAARISTGREWPFGGGECAPLGKVLYISGEDDPEDTLRPRLRALGADLSSKKIAFLTSKELVDFNVSGPRFARAAGRAIDKMGGCDLVIIDPPSAFLAGVDENSNAEVRGILQPMKEWATQHDCSIAFNAHTNKGSGKKLDAQLRILGSVAWVNGPRVANIVTRDQEDPAVRLFIPLKTNISGATKALSFRIVPHPIEHNRAVLQWIAEVDVDAQDAMNERDQEDGGHTKALQAERWIIEKFRGKTTWQSKDLFEYAAEELGDDQLPAVKHARIKLGIQSKKVGQNWVCWVAENWPYLDFKS